MVGGEGDGSLAAWKRLAQERGVADRVVFHGELHGEALDRVAAAVDTAFVESGWHSGAADRNCAICAGMAGVMDEIYADLDAGCRRRLAGVTIADIEDRLFAGKPLFAAEQELTDGI